MAVELSQFGYAEEQKELGWAQRQLAKIKE